MNFYNAWRCVAAWRAVGQKNPAPEVALPVGELAASGSENGYAALVALKSSRRTVFWFDGAAKSGRKSVSLPADGQPDFTIHGRFRLKPARLYAG
jgi:hypothetical protein